MVWNQHAVVSIGNVTLDTVDASGVQWILDTAGFDGWSGSPNSTSSPVQKPRQSGAWMGLLYLTPRYLALRGYIAAPTGALLDAAIDQLNAAVSVTATTLSVTESAYTRSISVQRSDEVQTVKMNDVVASFSIQVVALDPRKTGTPLVGQTFLPASSGGLTIPFTVPFAISSTVVSGSISLTNPGNVAGSAIFRIDGPTGGPVITHQGVTGNSLVFSSSLILNAGEWLTINNDARTALANDQASRNSYITSRGWSAFDPGVNTWSFTASSYNVLSKLTVTATPSWL